VRRRIEGIAKEEVRYAAMTTYLWGARISEVISKVSPSDRTKARGPNGSNVRADVFRYETYRPELQRTVWMEEPVAIFALKTAKRQGQPRNVALPLEYDPWVSLLLNYFNDRKDRQVFPFTRQHVWNHAKDVFSGLKYPIDRYKVYSDGQIVKEVDKHVRDFNLHALRHLRATELVEFYGFDGFALSIYLGWTLSEGHSTVMGRYLALGWQYYFPKLLKRR